MTFGKWINDMKRPWGEKHSKKRGWGNDKKEIPGEEDVFMCARKGEIWRGEEGGDLERGRMEGLCLNSLLDSFHMLVDISSCVGQQYNYNFNIMQNVQRHNALPWPGSNFLFQLK